MELGKPWLFQIELVEGCNRICNFCGINAIRSAPGNYRYMNEATLVHTVNQIAEFSPQSKIVWAMHGEPLQHPKVTWLVGIARAILPKSYFMLVTNGKVLLGKMQERLEKLFDSGISTVILDTYYPERDALREEAAQLRGFRVIDFYDDKPGMAEVRPFDNHHDKLSRVVVLMDDLAARDGDDPTRKIHNHAGSCADGKHTPMSEPLVRTCYKPFRELSIEWDGTVNLCCEDWTRRFVLGNVTETTLNDIWYSPEIEAARAMLQNKRRDFAGCKVCDAPAGLRIGFLPKYGPVTEEQERLLRDVEARSGRPDIVQLRAKR